MGTENDKENQDEIQSNNNENDEQNKKVSEEFKEKVQEIIKNPFNFNFIIYYKISKATQNYLSKYKDLTNIGNTISEIVKGNPDSAFDIVNGFTQGCFSAGKDLTEIGNTISEIVQGNPDSAPDIVAGFTVGFISQENNSKYIDDTISKIVQGNPDSAFNIVFGFTQGCILMEKDLTNIGNVITKIIKTDKIKDNQDLEIIKTDKIKDNQDLVFNVINGFVKGCLMQKPDNIKDIAESFFNSLNGMEKETKDTLKPIFSLIVSQYFMNTLINSSNKQSSEDNKKEETETQLFNCYKELFHEEDNVKIKNFKDIPLKELSDSQDKYLEERFKKKGVDCGTEYETFLKMACNLILKSEGNKELTVTDLENKKDIFKDLKFIYLNNKDGIESKEQLFGKIGLTENDFGTKIESKGSDFSIVYCAYLNHGFVMIIDKTQEWNDAINSETESICLIDSSRLIEDRKTNGDTLLNVKEQIFKNTPTLNDHHYQKNSTCWLNAMSAIGFLLEKQQECIAKQKQEQQEQVKQTGQQVKKPYGLSINELLEGFGKKRDNESKKNIESATPQEKPSSSEQDICNITESATPPEKLSSFEQGICDYSTEHFYTLTNISDKERDIIKKFLAEQVKQNKTSEENILKLFSELDTSNLIIKQEHLEESFERFKKDAKRLEELCTKFNIDYTKLSKSKRKEDSNDNKQKDDPLSECRPNDAEEPENPEMLTENPETLKNIKKSSSCCTIF